MLKCDFNEVALELYLNCTSAWVFSCKFATYFQNTFSYKHIWMAASGSCVYCPITLNSICISLHIFDKSLLHQINFQLSSIF